METRRQLALCLTGTLCLAWAALWNGFPLLTPDGGGYVARALELKPAFHQPIAYSLWIRIVSAGISLWLPIMAQTGLLALALILWAGELGYRNNAGVICIAAAFLSPLPWYSSQVMSDAFTPIFVLSFFLFLHAERPKTRFVALALLTLSTAMHFSHWMLLPLLGLFCFREYPKRVVVAVATLIVIALGTRELNRVTSGSPSLQRGATSFLMGRLYETGILERYLDRHCDDTPLALCQTEGPRKGPINYFLWDRSSPHFQVADEIRGQEYREILKGALKEHPISILEHSLLAFLRQLSRFAVGDAAGKQGNEREIAATLQKLSPSDAAQFLGSRQQQGINYTFWNIFYTLVLVSSMVSIVRRWRHSSGTMRAWIRFLTGALLGNAAICGMLTGAFHRYEGRLIGLVTVTAIASEVTFWMQSRDRLFWLPRSWARRAPHRDFSPAR